MRLYFHLTNGTEIISDDIGLEVAHPDDIRDTIAADLEELKREFPLEHRRGWRLEVTDPSGAVHYSLPLSGCD